VPLYLYNYLSPDSRCADAQGLLPEGSRLVIKEPYLKCFNSGCLGLRCDNPTNVVVTSRGPLAQPPAACPALADAPAAQRVGNACFRDRDHTGAVIAYTEGLTLCPEPGLELTLLANRAAAYLASDQPALALEDCTKALGLDPGGWVARTCDFALGR
jgi:tetratricopeptide (TPR) repeat protein